MVGSVHVAGRRRTDEVIELRVVLCRIFIDGSKASIAGKSTVPPDAPSRLIARCRSIELAADWMGAAHCLVP